MAAVTGRRQYSHDLVQGGLEIPCCLTFRGVEKEILKKMKIGTTRNSYNGLIKYQYMYYCACSYIKLCVYLSIQNSVV